MLKCRHNKLLKRWDIMLTIAIDEYGYFHHDDQVSFVGEYIYW